MGFAKLYENLTRVLKKLVLHHSLALFLIPNPRRYIGYRYIIIWEMEYFPLGENRWQYLRNCIREMFWPWQSDATLKLLVDRSNRKQGLWQQLLGDSVQ